MLYTDTNSQNITYAHTLACRTIDKELDLTELLAETFTKDHTRKILTIASFLATGGHGGMSAIEDFSAKFKITDEIITNDALQGLYSNIPGLMIEDFFKQWIKQHGEENFACYDVAVKSLHQERMATLSFDPAQNTLSLPELNLAVFVHKRVNYLFAMLNIQVALMNLQI